MQSGGSEEIRNRIFHWTKWVWLGLLSRARGMITRIIYSCGGPHHPNRIRWDWEKYKSLNPLFSSTVGFTRWWRFKPSHHEFYPLSPYIFKFYFNRSSSHHTITHNRYNIILRGSSLKHVIGRFDALFHPIKKWRFFSMSSDPSSETIRKNLVFHCGVHMIMVRIVYNEFYPRYILKFYLNIILFHRMIDHHIDIMSLWWLILLWYRILLK